MQSHVGAIWSRSAGCLAGTCARKGRPLAEASAWHRHRPATAALWLSLLCMHVHRYPSATSKQIGWSYLAGTGTVVYHAASLSPPTTSHGAIVGCCACMTPAAGALAGAWLRRVHAAPAPADAVYAGAFMYTSSNSPYGGGQGTCTGNLLPNCNRGNCISGDATACCAPGLKAFSVCAQLSPAATATPADAVM
jgi:hypothetical protein